MSVIVSELRALLAAATPGKWWRGVSHTLRSAYRDSEGLWHDQIVAHTVIVPSRREEACANADFCVAAKNNLPALLTVVEAAHEVVECYGTDRLQDACRALRDALAKLEGRS